MAKLTDLELRVKKLIELDIPVVMQNAIIDSEPIIIELLQKQLWEGKSGTGDPIMLGTETEYAPRTIANKKRLGLPTDRITLYHTGNFYEQMYTTIKGEVFSIHSSVPYFDKIVQRSGPDIMRLSADHMEYLITEYISPKIKLVTEEALNV